MFATPHQHLAAQRSLKTGHEKSRGNSLAGNVRDRNGDMRGAQLNEVIVVAADGPCGLADGFDFNAGNGRQSAREKLVLDLAGDSNFVLETPALGLFFNQLTDRRGHRKTTWQQ